MLSGGWVRGGAVAWWPGAWPQAGVVSSILAHDSLLAVQIAREIRAASGVCQSRHYTAVPIACSDHSKHSWSRWHVQMCT
jgi:hypothetical protein